MRGAEFNLGLADLMSVKNEDVRKELRMFELCIDAAHQLYLVKRPPPIVRLSDSPPVKGSRWRALVRRRVMHSRASSVTREPIDTRASRDTVKRAQRRRRRVRRRRRPRLHRRWRDGARHARAGKRRALQEPLERRGAARALGL